MFENAESPSLEWKITREEKRKRIQKMIVSVGIPLVILGIISAIVGFPEHSAYQLLTRGIGFLIQKTIYVALGIAVALILFFLVNMFIPYKERSYQLDKNGLRISKGRNQKEYGWDEFEFYYAYSKRNLNAIPSGIAKAPNYPGQEYREGIFASDRALSGDIFYLKKKSQSLISKLCKKFVVVYAEPDNSEAVSKFLSRRLERKNMKVTSDLGLVIYEFK